MNQLSTPIRVFFVLAFFTLGGCAALQPPAGPMAINNPGFEEDYLADSGDGSWHFRIRQWAGQRHGVMNPSIAQFKSGGAPEGRNAGFLSRGGSSMYQNLGVTLLPYRSYELQVLVGRRMESSFGPGEYVLELFAGNELLASKPGKTPPAGEFVVDTLRYDSPTLLPESAGPLRIQIRNLNARMINFDNLRLFSWNRSESYRPPPLTYEATATTEGCVSKPQSAWQFPHVAYPHQFNAFDGLAGSATVSEHAALSSVYELEVIDDKWLFERGFNCQGLLGTHPLNRRKPSTLHINTIDDTFRYVVLPHNAGNGSRIELWANGQQLHSADLSGNTVWIDRTVALPPGTSQVTLYHHATGWRLEHLFWQYLGPADPGRLSEVPPIAGHSRSTVPVEPPQQPPSVSASPTALPRYWHMRVEPTSSAVPVDPGIRAFWDAGVYVYFRDDGQIGFNPESPAPYFYQGEKTWRLNAGQLHLNLDGMRYILAAPDNRTQEQTLTTLDENGGQFRMLLVPKAAGQR